MVFIQIETWRDEPAASGMRLLAPPPASLRPGGGGGVAQFLGRGTAQAQWGPYDWPGMAKGEPQRCLGLNSSKVLTLCFGGLRYSCLMIAVVLYSGWLFKCKFSSCFLTSLLLTSCVQYFLVGGGVHEQSPLSFSPLKCRILFLLLLLFRFYLIILNLTLQPS